MKHFCYFFFSGFFVDTAGVLKTAFYNTTVKKNGNIELVIEEYQPANPFDLSCFVLDITRSPSTLILAYFDGRQMIINPTTASFKTWKYLGRVYVKNNFTIVITQITFEQQGRKFSCVLRESRFSPVIERSYILGLVLGKLPK